MVGEVLRVLVELGEVGDEGGRARPQEDIVVGVAEVVRETATEIAAAHDENTGFRRGAWRGHWEWERRGLGVRRAVDCSEAAGTCLRGHCVSDGLQLAGIWVETQSRLHVLLQDFGAKLEATTLTHFPDPAEISAIPLVLCLVRTAQIIVFAAHESH